jgi:hypothetical protein
VNVCGTNYRTTWSQAKEEQNSTTLMAEKDCRTAEAVFAEGRGMMSNKTEAAKEIAENKTAFSL